MISKKKYLELCRLFNSILKSSESNLETISIPWLHIIREHPIFLNRYKKIIKHSFFELFLNKVKNIIFLILQLYKSLHTKKNSYWFGSKQYEKNIDYLFVSHLINKNKFSIDEDMYFSNIPLQLKKSGKKVAISSLVAINNSKFFFKKYFKQRNLNRYFFNSSLTFFSEIRLYLRLKKESIRLKRKSKLNIQSSLEKKVYHLASMEATSKGSLDNLRLHKQIQKLVEKLNPKLIITTYEGHAFERIIFHAARSVNPKIICASYQHSVIFPLSNSIKIKLSEKYNPDYILTSGKTTKDEFMSIIDLQPIKIMELGSSRGTYENEPTANIESHNFSCLVLPEVYLSECNFLFEFSLKCAIEYPKIKFIWRLHPGISFNDVFRKNNNLSNLPKNIILSQSSLEKDIRHSKWVLYRGSTAVFKALSYGLRPLYLTNKNEISIDPLFNLNKFKHIVKEPARLNSLIKNDIKNNFKDQIKFLTISKNHCKNQFSSFSLKPLESILN